MKSKKDWAEFLFSIGALAAATQLWDQDFKGPILLCLAVIGLVRRRWKRILRALKKLNVRRQEGRAFRVLLLSLCLACFMLGASFVHAVDATIRQAVHEISEHRTSFVKDRKPAPTAAPAATPTPTPMPMPTPASAPSTSPHTEVSYRKERIRRSRVTSFVGHGISRTIKEESVTETETGTSPAVETPTPEPTAAVTPEVEDPPVFSPTPTPEATVGPVETAIAPIESTPIPTPPSLNLPCAALGQACPGPEASAP